jgi:hypothetical protein
MNETKVNMDAHNTLNKMEIANIEAEKAGKLKANADQLEKDAARATTEKVPMQKMSMTQKKQSDFDLGLSPSKAHLSI